MRLYFFKVLNLVAAILVASVGFHGFAAAAHPVDCLEKHEHAAAAGEAQGVTGDPEAGVASVDTDRDPHDGARDGVAVCHAIMIGCSDVLAKGATDVPVPDSRQIAFSLASVLFSSIQSPAAHRPPITAA